MANNLHNQYLYETSTTFLFVLHSYHCRFASSFCRSSKAVIGGRSKTRLKSRWGGSM